MSTRVIREMRFKDYIATKEELDADYREAEKLLAYHKKQGNGPMASKMQLRMKQIAQKKSKLTEGTVSAEKYKKKLISMTKEQLQQELNDLESIADSASKTKHGDDVQSDIELVKRALKRMQKPVTKPKRR